MRKLTAEEKAQRRIEVAEYKRRWHIEHRAQVLARTAAWRAAHPERIKERGKEYRERKHPQVLAAKRADYQAHRAERLEQTLAWRAANPDKVRIARNNRRNREVGRLSFDLAQKLHAEQNGLCCYCFTELSTTGHHLDHWRPLSAGGKNVDDNIVLACPACNFRKSAKDPLEFVREMNTWLR